MDIAQTIALTMGVAWASGINLYAAILMLGVMGATGNMALPADLQILTDPMVMGAAGFMYFVEFFTDKVPGVDTAWDGLSTFIRIPAGAILAAGVMGDVGPAAQLAAAIAGGTLTAGTHATKAGTRVLINTSPEPVSNWFASVGEDVAVILGLWAAIAHPVLFIVLLILFILFMIWALPKLWRGIRKIFSFLRRKPGNNDTEAPPAATPSSASISDTSETRP
jgi:hypothetical protein